MTLHRGGKFRFISSSTWRKNRPALRDYWRRREGTWRGLGIKAREHGGFFNRYDYRKLWLKQKGLCGLCDRPLIVKRLVDVGSLGQVGVGQGIDLDHGHHDGFARALLHGRCNRMVGVMDQFHALLVLNYLIKHESTEGTSR